MAEDLGVLGQALIAIRADIASLKKDLDQSKSVFKQATDDMTASAATAGKAMSVGLTAPILAFGGFAMKVASDFDEAFDTIRASTGATGDALSGLEDSFKTVFGSVPNSTKDVTTAIDDLNQRLGLTGPQLDKMATTMLNLSRITKTEINVAIQDATRLFAAWGITADKQVGTLDFLLAVTQKTGIAFGTLQQDLVEYGGTFRQLGIGVEQSAVMLGQFEKNGVNVGQAMSGLTIAARTFAKENIPLEQGLKDVIARMQQLGPSSAATTIAVQTFGRAGIQMADAMARGQFNVDALMASIKGSTDTIEKAAFDTLSYADKWKVLTHQVEIAIEPLGTGILNAIEGWMPKMEAAIKLVQGLGFAFGQLPGPVQTATFAFVGLLAAVGPVMFAFSKIATSWGVISGLLTTLGNTVGVLTVRIWALEAAEAASATALGGFILASGPIIVALAGITAAVTIGYQAWQLYAESKARAQSQAKQDEVDSANLKRINEALGTSFKTLAEAVAEVNKRRKEGNLPGQDKVGPPPDADAAWKKLAAQVKEAHDQLNALSSSKKIELKNLLDAGMSPGDISKQLQGAVSPMAIEIYKKALEEAKSSTKELESATQEMLSKTTGFWDEYTADVSKDSGMELSSRLLGLKTWYDKQYDDIQKTKALEQDKDNAVEALNAALYGKMRVVVDTFYDEVMKDIHTYRDETTAAQAAVNKGFEGQPDFLKQLAASMAAFSGELHGVNELGMQIGTTFSTNVGQISRDAFIEAERAALGLSDAEKESVQRMKEQGFTAQEIAEKLKLPLNQVNAIVGANKRWMDSIAGLAGAFAQLAQISGGALGGILGGIGEIVGALSLTSKAMDQFSQTWKDIHKPGAGGLSGGLSGLGGLMNTVSNVGSLAGDVVGGVSGVISATGEGSTAQRTIGGALSGMKLGATIGSVIPGIGTAVGAAVGAIAGAVTGLIRSMGRSAEQRISEDIGKSFGMTLSDALVKKIDAAAGSLKGGYSNAGGALMSLGDIIAEHPIDTKNLDTYLEKEHDIFSAVQQGVLTTAEATQALDKSFKQIADASTDSLGLVSQKLKDIIKLDGEFGTASKAVSDFISAQGQSAAAGITKAVGITAGAYDARDAAAKSGDQAGVDKANALIDATGPKSQQQAGGEAAAVLGAFGAMIKGGASFSEVIKTIGPAVQNLQKILQATGFAGGVAFDKLAAAVGVANDEIAGPALEAADGWRQALVGLSNSGFLTQDMFAGLSGQITQTYQSLIKQGKDGDAVMKLMQPDLQTVWELQKKFGYAVDDGTQALLDQAEANGTVGEKFMSAQDQMVQALDKTNDILQAIGKFMGVTFPEDAKTGAQKAKAEFEKLHPEVKVDIVYDDHGGYTLKPRDGTPTGGDTSSPGPDQSQPGPGSPTSPDNSNNGGGGPDNSGAQNGYAWGGIYNTDPTQMKHFDLGGIYKGNYGADRGVAMVRDGEAILTNVQQDKLVRALGDKNEGNTFAPNFSGSVILDGPSFTRFLDEHVGPWVPDMMLRDVAGTRKAVKKVAKG